MKKPPCPQIVEEAYDTGIYRDEPKRFFPLRTESDWKAFKRNSEEENATVWNPDHLLQEAETYARKITERYDDHSRATPALLEQWEWYALACREKRPDAESLRPPFAYRAGIPLSPSKKDRIPENVKRQFHWARHLLGQVSIARSALETGDTKKAAVHMYWVGRYLEGLRVCRVEHVAARERKTQEGRKRAHAAKHGTVEEKQRRWGKYQEEIDTLYAKAPHWSYEHLCSIVAKQYKVSTKTIKRHTTNPHKTI